MNIKDWTLYSIEQSREIFVFKTLKGVSLQLTKAAPTLCDKFESSAKLAIRRFSTVLAFDVLREFSVIKTKLS